MNTPVRILLDNGVFIHSEFAEGAEKATSLRWANKDPVFLHGFVRKAPVRDQEQMEALFTVGRLIREGRIEAFDYNEIQFEGMKHKRGLPVCNALQGCCPRTCPPAVQRSKFRTTHNFAEFISKGGKEDREAGIAPAEGNQIAFFQWLRTLTRADIEALIPLIDLTVFEIENLRNIEWFKSLCQRSQSPENYPDVFHLWTAERNGLDAFLTLDATFQNLVCGVRNEKVRKIEIRAEVLRPLDLLQKLGIDKPDPVPMEHNRFYHLHEFV